MIIYCVEFNGELSNLNCVFSTMERARAYIPKVIDFLIGCKNLHEVEGEDGWVWAWDNTLRNVEEYCIICEREIDDIPEVLM